MNAGFQRGRRMLQSSDYSTQQPDLGTKRKEVGEPGRKKWVKKIEDV